VPTFNSKEGIWEPAMERVVDPKAPKGQEIYEGPDRAAMEMLKEQNVTHLGMHYSVDPELVMRARQLGFKNVEEYLKMFNYDKRRAEIAYEENKAKINEHKDLDRKQPGNFIGGGEDTARQGKTRPGGFGFPDDVPGTRAGV